MIDGAEKWTTLAEGVYFGPGRILEIDEAKGDVRVLLSRSESDQGVCKTRARLAIPYPCDLEWGETVLVAGEKTDNFYVIGVLNRRAGKKGSENRLVLKNGAKAEVDGPPDSEILKVFSEDGGLIFEYDANTGKSRVDIPTGDLEIITKNGNIDFISAKGVRFFSKNAIEMKSLRGIRMAASNARSKTLSAFDLGPEKIDLKGPQVGITARKGEMQIEETKYTGKKLSACIENVKLIVERFETLAGNVMEKARNIYRTVEELTELKTGRMRTLVDEVCQFKSKKAFLKAVEDFKIKGEKIHLG